MRIEQKNDYQNIKHIFMRLGPLPCPSRAFEGGRASRADRRTSLDLSTRRGWPEFGAEGPTAPTGSTGPTLARVLGRIGSVGQTDRGGFGHPDRAPVAPMLDEKSPDDGLDRLSH